MYIYIIITIITIITINYNLAATFSISLFTFNITLEKDIKNMIVIAIMNNVLNIYI